ncbi:MAG: helix-turn-helix domain-containing protein [Planctomycetes bacterium]|nr:helix-turn-helix domain-containing protein [Planctomycetota bacterium]
MARPSPEWLPVAAAARRLRVHPTTVLRWALSGKIPSQRLGPRRLLVRGVAAEAVASSWPCPALRCPFEGGGPEALAGHLRVLHGAGTKGGWRCPGPGCKSSALRGVEDLARHMERHAADFRALGVAERRRRGRPNRPGPKPGCSVPGCDRPTVAKGTCWAHYAQDRRGGKAKQK